MSTHLAQTINASANVARVSPDALDNALALKTNTPPSGSVRTEVINGVAYTVTSVPTVDKKTGNVTRVRDLYHGTPALKSELESWRAAHGSPVNEKLAAQIGLTRDQLSKWLNDKYEGDIADIEHHIRAHLARQENKAQAPRILGDIIETLPHKLVMKALMMIDRTSDFGLIVGPAGIGKTTGGKAWCGKNPTALFLTVMRGYGTAHGVQSLILDKLPERGVGNKRSPAYHIIDALSETNRHIIVDNGHELTNSGYGFFFDLHSITGCPITLMGNGSMEGAIRGISHAAQERNEQWVSRVGYRESLRITGPDGKPIPKYSTEEIAHYIGLYGIEEPSEELIDLASRIAEGPGHLRSLRQHLKLAVIFCGAPGVSDAAAFRAAHTKLLTKREIPLHSTL